MKTWILVASSNQAKIYNTNKTTLFNGNGKKLHLVKELAHSESRLRDIDLTSDRQGQFGSGTFQSPTDPKKHQEEVFAIEIVRNLSKSHAENLFEELIFIAPAAFMGMINKHMPHELDRVVNLRIEKDYIKCPEQELVEHLQKFL